MRSRSIAFALTLLLSALCFTCVAGSTAARAGQAPPPTPTTAPAVEVEVEVEGKVVERAPEKSPVPMADLPTTGSDHAGTLVVVGLVLLAVGAVLIDQTSTPTTTAAARLPQRHRRHAAPPPRRAPPPRHRTPVLLAAPWKSSTRHRSPRSARPR